MSSAKEYHRFETIDEPQIFECDQHPRGRPAHGLWRPIRATVSKVEFSEMSERGLMFNVVEIREWSDGNRTRAVYRFDRLGAARAEALRFVAKTRSEDEG